LLIPTVPFPLKHAMRLVYEAAPVVYVEFVDRILKLSAASLSLNPIVRCPFVGPSIIAPKLEPDNKVSIEVSVELQLLIIISEFVLVELPAFNAPLTVRAIPAAVVVVPTPTRLFVASTNNVFVSTVRLPVNVVLPVTPRVPDTLRLLPAPVIVSEPVMVSPALRTFAEAAPVRFAVIVPAAKLPEASRITAVETTFVLLNVMLPAFQMVLPLSVNPLASTTLTSRVPLEVDPLPPVATIAALYVAANCDELKYSPGEDA